MCLAKRKPVVDIFSPEETVANAVRRMRLRGVRAILVVQDTELVGIMTDRDIVCRALVANVDISNLRIERIMTRAPVTSHPDEAIECALAKMHAARCRHLPILVGGQPADTLSIRDLLAVELEERSSEVEMLLRYIQGDRVL